MQCIIPKSQTFVTLVKFLDDSKRFFKIPIKQKGMATLTNIIKSIPVDNKEYFGLKYFDKFMKPHWINLDKSLFKQLQKSHLDKTPATPNELCYNIEFEVRYYPRDPTSIDDENFRYQIFLQIRKDLATMKLVIKDETVLSTLCGLILQSDFGDYSGNRFAPHYIRQSICSHLLTPFLEDKIKNEHIKLRGVEPIDAEYRFLEKVRWLENYGTIIFPVKDNNNKYCYFGLNPQGFSLRYHKEPNLNYDIFWPRVSAIKRKRRQLIIKEKTDVTKKYYFETGEKLLCIVLYKLCLDHFAFFKLKKDEKPRVNEPPKRSFGRSASKEFGYSSDTSDCNQYSDDTFSSYPDSINTTQSSKISKGFKKTNIPQRNCISDIEESALSRKNRRVIVSKSQTETEDEGIKFSDTLTLKTNTLDCSSRDNVTKKPITHSQSYDRIPPDYIYENRLSKSNEQNNEQIRRKRMRKRVQNPTNIERKVHGCEETKPFNENSPKEAFVDRTVDVSKPNEIVIRQTRPRPAMSSTERKTRTPRILPLPNPVLQSSESIIKDETPYSDNRINQSASVDSISTLKKTDYRFSPNKRMLPDLSAIVSANSTLNPPIPKHRIQPRVPFNQSNPIKTQSVYADIWYQPCNTINQPGLPQHSNLIPKRAYVANTIPDKFAPNKLYQRPNIKYHTKFRPTSGI